MKDQILAGYLDDFQGQHGLEKLSESDLFSRFVTYCVISKSVGGPVSLDELDVDGGQDTGIDVIAILINDRVVTDKEDVDFFKTSGRLDVEFVFVQAKTSPKFDGADIGTFLSGVRNFFSSAPTIEANSAVKEFREIKDYIYQKNSIHLRHAPTCRLYYASSGKWTNEPYLRGRIEQETQELKKTNLFHDIIFTALDAERLKADYRALRHRVEKEVQFDKHTILPKIERAEEAYLGILPSDEFLKLITDDDGNLQKSLFYDNIRDFLGSNPVNNEIATTLADSSASGRFVILNNGVTIVAKAINKIGASFRITDYQIVNGCQTSNVIFLNRQALGPSVYVPIKLIVTSDPELMNQIIMATNRQTEVKLEAFESLSPFHRTIEEFYGSFGKDAVRRLYYERRSKQYANTPVKPTSIVSLATQAKSYLGMFLNEPHSTHRYYGEILASNRDRLFREDHCPDSYYAAGLALNRVDGLFRGEQLPYGLRRFRFHLLLLFRMAVAGEVHPPLRGKPAIDYAKTLCEVLWQEDKTLSYFKNAFDRLRERLRTFPSAGQSQADRLRAFTSHLLPDSRVRPRGIVKLWNVERGFGFIRTNDGQDVFAHYTAIRETIHKYLREGEAVEFDITATDRGPQARDVRLIVSRTDDDT